ncbi:glycosyltransferase [Clostridium botulinum]|uniref:glycosyltransferase n=1 Tax=Clostridium botulinum TaxID=1491 RepID=UPI0013F13333|nr:glycosyltransferase [Clostridium botulinum]MBY6917960.1 glycosyltransferase [Clostridium botulinum]NFL35841.1 glycosyltransferase [Clostridium botulinum]NFM05037.1 glycosyltransferase [Clostridium botulinum]NFO40972.1 glycosyltransferase [Clostridium botulinum]NFQ39714.1 glycosyltransferase [Clostridium botulinum]
MNLSIIIPVYNSEKTIEKCLDSIIVQELEGKEIILIDDGSKDNSLKILLKYEKKYDYIKVVSQKNMGQGIARNRGIEIAKGDYITFVDSDDYISGIESYSNLLEKCYKNDLDMLIFNYSIVQNNIKNQVVNLKENIIFSGEDILIKFLLTNEVEGYSCNKIFKSNLLRKYGIKFIEGKKYEDIPLVVDVIMLSRKIEFDNTRIYNYVMNNLSTTKNININTLNDEVDCLELIIDKILSLKSNEMNLNLETYIKNRVKLYSVYRFKNLLKFKINLKEFLYINKRYLQLLRKVVL